MSRQKTGGRQKGTPNKRTTEMVELMANLGCNPAERLAIIAMEAEAEGNHLLAVDCYKSLMPYIYPKRKSIETLSPNEIEINYIGAQNL